MLIYRAYNIVNGKSYIGKTEKTLELRKNLHFSSVKQGSKFAFHRAIAKYGVESFVWEILDTTNNVFELNTKEKYYIKLYESFSNKGYNMTAGGEGQTGWKPSANTRELWSKQRKGKSSWNAGTAKTKVKSPEEKQKTQEIANQKRSQALTGRKTWNAGLKGVYARTNYKVIYKDGTEKIGTKLDLGLPKTTIDTMFRDKCGSRKYNIKKIERI
jgi:group I intron endonuclease